MSYWKLTAIAYPPYKVTFGSAWWLAGGGGGHTLKFALDIFKVSSLKLPAKCRSNFNGENGNVILFVIPWLLYLQ